MKRLLVLPGALSHRFFCRERATRRLIMEDAMTKLSADRKRCKREAATALRSSLHLVTYRKRERERGRGREGERERERGRQGVGIDHN